MMRKILLVQLVPAADGSVLETEKLRGMLRAEGLIAPSDELHVVIVATKAVSPPTLEQLLEMWHRLQLADDDDLEVVSVSVDKHAPSAAEALEAQFIVELMLGPLACTPCGDPDCLRCAPTQRIPNMDN